MTWVKLDDAFADHPKFAVLGEVSPLGKALFVSGLCYCARYLTDGELPAGQVARLEDFSPYGTTAREVADALVRAGLWERAEGGYRVHDYLDYQPSRAKVEQKRREEGERKARAGKARAEQAERDGGGRFTKAAGQNQHDQQPHQQEHQHAAGEQAAPAAPRKAAGQNQHDQQPHQHGSSPVPVPVPEPQPLTRTHKSKDKPLSFSDEQDRGLPASVLGYWQDKTGKEPSAADLASLRTLCKRFRPETVNLAIGQAVSQGEQADNFALITTIAKHEVAS